MGDIYEMQRDQFGRQFSIAPCRHSLMTSNKGVESWRIVDH
jgi:hypothetical protein